MTDPRLLELGDVGAVAEDAEAVESAGGKLDSLLPMVDDDDVVAIGDELLGEAEPASAGSEDDDLLARTSLLPLLFTSKDFRACAHDNRWYAKAKV